MHVRRLSGCFVWLLLTLVSCSMVAADTPGNISLKPDLRLLIDVSGSMQESDPDNLRAPALELIVRLLPEGSRAGVWTFGDTVEALVPHGLVDDSWREQAIAAVAAIDNSGLRTNIPAALTAATQDLGSVDPGYRASLVLLTDGKVDVSESPMANAAAARRVLDTTAPELGQSGVRVHTIALSNEADWGFLRALARATGGVAEQAETPQALTGVYLQALEMVAPTARVPVDESGFSIDESVREFTVLVFLPELEGKVRLISPDGVRYRPADAIASVTWMKGPRFALVTVTEPLLGQWQLEAPEGIQTRVTVLSNLELEVDPVPNSLPAGRASELGIRLRQRGEIITSPELLAVFGLSVDIEGPAANIPSIDVTGTYAAPADGEYRVAIPPIDLPGRYIITVRADTGTLQRELPVYVEVTGTGSREVISTRALDVPMQDLESAGMTLAVLLLLALALLMLVLRGRKRRKLETYQRRVGAVKELGDMVDAAEESSDRPT